MVDQVWHWHRRRNGRDLEFVAKSGRPYGHMAFQGKYRSDSVAGQESLTSKEEWQRPGICGQIWKAKGPPKKIQE